MTDRRDDEELEGDDDEFNIVSEDEEVVESPGLFAEGQVCDVCGADEGRIGLDPTCRGAYDGEPVLYCYGCAADGLKAAWDGVEGIAIVVEPFGDYSAQFYYRLDEMPAYQFVREDVESVSWMLLTIGDACARCGQQSHVAWLTQEFVDPRLPEGKPVFRNLDGDNEHLCNSCAAASLVEVMASMKLPLMTVELARGAMGVLMPTAE
jgi:hypothetical protein